MKEVLYFFLVSIIVCRSINESVTMKFLMMFFQIGFIAILFFASGCDRQSKQDISPQYGKENIVDSNRVEYIFAIHPLHNSRKYFEVYQPLVDYINRNTNEFYLRLEASKDYPQFEEKLIQRKFHFALPNPYQSVRSIQYGYSIFGKMGDDERFRGIIIVRKDSHIRSVNDLKGSSISFPSATALAAAMMPKYFLKSNGLDAEKDAQCLYVGSQESSIMNVFLGKTKAGCTWPPPWESFLREHPEMKEALTVQWETEPLINNGLVVRNDIPNNHTAIISKLLFTLHTSHEGREILKKINLSRFDPIAQQAYTMRVNTFLRKYETLCGPLPRLGGKQ